MFMLMIDNYDSFTHNLVQLFYEFDLEVRVYRNDQISLSEIEHLKPDWICVSPGPKDPAHAGISKDVIRRFASAIPTLGVCLGMQAINEVFGGITVKAPEPVHGKRSRIEHSGCGIFSGIPSPIWVARYHSLQIVMRSQRLMPLAHAPDRVVMAVQHESWPLWGVQFHPESFLSEYGVRMAANFLALQPQWRSTADQPSSCQECFPRIDPAVVRDSSFCIHQNFLQQGHP